MDLFDHAHQERLKQSAPLAARMRPRTLDEFVGQDHIIGPGRLLRRAIQADQLGSLIFYGPPGTGKTTLAQVIANTTRAYFIALNAVLSGVKEIRAAVADAQERAKLYQSRTILFVDEVHRFNKAQQDALLPWVENGTVIFVGATTENPYFEVNSALVSRSRIFQLTQLQSEHLYQIAQQALQDPERGYGKRDVEIDTEALDHLVDVAGGDARGLLNALELAVVTSGDAATGDGNEGPIHITLAIAEESIQRRAVLYDKEGDYHFDTISAYIKSLRGSDPDAAIYWLAKMLYAGEAPRFIFRRMLVFASEDVGMADPNAVQVVVACAEAFERMGMPEGLDALKMVEAEADSGVPNPLKDASRDKEGFGHGEGYLYPHAYRDHWVAQQYLPTSLQGKVFYQPSDQGYEAAIRTEVARRREAQLAAMLAAEDEQSAGELLTHSPTDSAKERWLQRTISQAGEQLGTLRDRVLDQARLARHSRVLDLKAGSGLLTWEALRRVPEGGVYTLARAARDGEAIRQQATRLPEVERPIIWEGNLASLGERFAEQPDLHFDAIVGHNALLDSEDKQAATQSLCEYLAPDGRIVLAEQIPFYTQRLYKLVELKSLDTKLQERLIEAEEAIYTTPDDPLVNWREDTLQSAFEAAGFQVEIDLQEQSRDLQVTEALLARWFENKESGRPSYGQRLQSVLSAEEIDTVQQLFERQLKNQMVGWSSRLVFLVAG